MEPRWRRVYLPLLVQKIALPHSLDSIRDIQHFIWRFKKLLNVPVETVRFFYKNRQTFLKTPLNFHEKIGRFSLKNRKLTWKSCLLFLKNWRKSWRLFRENFTIFLKKMCRFLKENLTVFTGISYDLRKSIWRSLQEHLMIEIFL